jgi:hypothetical protein
MRKQLSSACPSVRSKEVKTFSQPQVECSTAKGGYCLKHLALWSYKLPTLQQIAPKGTLVNFKTCKIMVDHTPENEVSLSKICCSNEEKFHFFGGM